MRVECCNIRAGQDRAPHFHMDLLCVTIARRDFMIGLSYFYSCNNSHFFDKIR